MKTKEIIQIHNEFQSLLNKSIKIEDEIRLLCFEMMINYKSYFNEQLASEYLAENIFKVIARMNFILNYFYFGGIYIDKKHFKTKVSENKITLFYKGIKVKDYKRGEL